MIKRGFVGYSGAYSGKQSEYRCVIKMNPNPTTLETLAAKLADCGFLGKIPMARRDELEQQALAGAIKNYKPTKLDEIIMRRVDEFNRRK